MSHSGIRQDLQNVRRVDWWTKFGKNVYPMMDQLASLFIWLRGEPHGRIIFLHKRGNYESLTINRRRSIELSYRMATFIDNVLCHWEH